MSEPTNAERAAIAEACVRVYKESWAPEEDLSTCARDLQTNLLHLLRREGESDEEIERSVVASHEVFREEEAEETDDNKQE